MGVGVGDAPAPEPLAAAVPPQQIVGVVDLVAALAQHGAAVPLTDGPGGGLHAGGVGDGEAGEDLRLGNVGRQYRGQRQQLRRQGVDGVVPQELCAGGGHHDGVHHHALRAIPAQLLRDDGNQRCRGDHADLHRVGGDVREHGVQLLRQEVGGGLQDVCDAGGVLGRQGRDRAGGEYAVGGHGLDVGLDPGASAGIASSNGQCCFHDDLSFLFSTAQFYNAMQGGAPNAPLDC